MFSRIFSAKIKRYHHEIGLTRIEIYSNCHLNLLVDPNINMNIHWNQADSRLHMHTNCIQFHDSHDCLTLNRKFLLGYAPFPIRLSVSPRIRQPSLILLSNRFEIEILDSIETILMYINAMINNTLYFRKLFGNNVNKNLLSNSLIESKPTQHNSQVI